MHTHNIRAYLISPKELRLDWLLLYTVTFAIQLLCASLRGALCGVVLWLLLKVSSQPTGLLHTLVPIIAYGPLALSLLTLVLPLAASWPPAHYHARHPTDHEQATFNDTLRALLRLDPTLRTPRRLLLTDDEDQSTPIAHADTLLLANHQLEHPEHPEEIARALAHLSSSDARLTAALDRLTIPLPETIPRGLRTACLFASGAAGMWPLKGAWNAYWRTRAHQAAQYADTLNTTRGSQRLAGHSEPFNATPSGPPTARPDGLHQPIERMDGSATIELDHQ